MVAHPEVLARVRRGLDAHNRASGGSSSLHVARALLMTKPPSIDGNELTDKGCINQRAGLDRRAVLVARLVCRTTGRGRDRAGLTARARARARSVSGGSAARAQAGL